MFIDHFDGKELNKKVWIETYLPQWSSRDKTRPSYNIKDSVLSLYISNDQKPWSEEYNGDIRVSNLQTGVFSGPVGSSIGQHHFSDNLIVREAQKEEFLLTPLYGSIEMKCRCHISEENVAALWLIGLEKNESESSELCLFELKGWNVKDKKAVIGYGIRAFKDPKLVNDFHEDEFDIDVEDWNIYKVDWRKNEVIFYINGKEIRRINQAPAYRMQLMLNLYDLKNIKNEENRFEIDYIKII